MIKWIIFSKNRPAQLDLLLRSMIDNYPTCHPFIIYKATDEDFARGYRKLRDYHLKPHYIPETNFRYDVMNLLTGEAVGFLTDDDLFINYFWAGAEEFHEFIRNDHIACLSLRMHPGITYSYTKQMNLNPPQFRRGELNIWEWSGQISYWGYPMSLDGHIFRTDDLKIILSSIDFNNPNELEGMMAAEPIARPLMICFDKPKVINVPMNIVNTVVKNRNMNLDPVQMNHKFLAGYRIYMKTEEKYTSCHIKINHKWK